MASWAVDRFAQLVFERCAAEPSGEAALSVDPPSVSLRLKGMLVKPSVQPSCVKAQPSGAARAELDERDSTLLHEASDMTSRGAKVSGSALNIEQCAPMGPGS
jgi:hypothetical protein